MKTIFSLFCLSVLALSASAQEAGNAVLKHGMQYLNTPYVAHTLEVNEDEQLVVNLRQVDCTTLVEYVLAQTFAAGSNGEKDSAAFTRCLQNIRYRNGRIEGYTSRLHYIAEWVKNATSGGFLQDITAVNSPDTVVLSLNFMSSHPEAYKQLAASPQQVKQMKAIEQSLTGQVFHYLPSSKLPDAGLPWIKDGDIIAITTRIAGLDVAHLGIAYYKKGELKLLHASSSAKKVVVTTNSLAQMLKTNPKFTGIRVLRAMTN